MAITFQIGFSVDDKQLKQGLQGIQKDIQNAFQIKGGMTEEIQKATQEAMILEKALKRATTDKGISYFSLTSELNKAGSSAAQLVTNLTLGGERFRASLNAANTALAMSNRQVISLNAKIQEMARVMTQSFKFTAAQTFLQGISNAAQEAYQWVENLNKAVNEIGVVTGKTDSQLDAVTQNAIEGSQRLRVAAQDYAEGALIFYQQGLNDDEVARRNEITIQAAEAAGASVQEMSSQLTAIWNTYKMVGDEQQRAASVGAKMAADTAVDFSDIAEAMQTAAAPAEQMGVSYNSLAAIIATVGDTTQQSASVIGNAFKTIFSRFQQLKSEGTDGEVTLNRVSSQLQELGVNVLDSAGNLRNLDTVIAEVGNQWDSWSSKQQLAIAQLVGGTRQYGQFLTLMNNFNKYQDLLNSANMEDGSSLTQQYEQAVEDIDTYATMASESWSRAFDDILKTDTIKTFYSTLEDVGDVFGTIIDSVGGLPGILAIIGGIFANKIVPSTISAAKNIKEMVTSLTAGGRARNINRDHDAINSQLNTRLGIAQSREGSSDLNSAAGKEVQNLQVEKQKNEFGRQTALINDKINTALKSASGHYKINLEYQQQQLKSAQELYQQATDQLAILERQNQAQKNLAQTQANEAKAAKKSAQKEYEDAFASSLVANENLEIEESKTGPDRDAKKIAAARSEAAAATKRLEEATIKLDQANERAQLFDNSKVVNFRNALNELNAAYAKMGTSGGSLAEMDEAFNKLLVATEKLSGKNLPRAKAQVEQIRSALAAGKTTALEDANAKVDQLSGLSDEAKNKIKQLNEVLLNSNGSKIDEVKADLAGMDDLGEQARQAIEKLQQELIGDMTSSLEKANSELIEFAKNSKTAEAAAEELTTNTQISETRATQHQAEQRTQRTGEDVDRTRQQSISPSKAIEGFGQLTGAITMATSAASVFWSTMQNEDASAAEKIIAIVSALSMLLPALQLAGTALSTLGVTATKAGLVIGAAGTTATIPWLPLVAILGGIVAAIAIVIAAVTAKRRAIEADIEAAQEEIDSTEELTSALESNSNALKENMAAWREASKTGENAQEAYQNLSDTILELNKNLEDAGISQDRINEAMQEAYASGNTESYDDLIAEAEVNTAKRNIEAHSQNINSQVDLMEAEGNAKRTVSLGLETTITPETKQIMEKYPQYFSTDYDTSYQDEVVNFTIDFTDMTPAEVTEQYEELLDLKKEAEDSGASKSIVNAIDSQIDAMSTYMDEIGVSVDEQKQNIIDLYSTVAKNSNIDFGSQSLKESYEYLAQVRQSLQQNYGDIYSTEELDGMLQSIAAVDSSLTKTIQTTQLIGQLVPQFITDEAVEKEKQNQQAIANGMKETSAQLDTAFADVRDKEAKWYLHRNAELENYKKNHTEAYNQMVTDISNATGIAVEELDKMNYDELADTVKKYGEEAEAALNNIDDAAEAATLQNTHEQLLDFFNNLSAENVELLLSANLEFANTPEELQQVLNNRYDLKMKIKAEIVTDEDHNATIERSNSLQEALNPAIEEYQENGEVTLDTANALIEAGYGEYLMVVGDQIKLTTAAQNDFNGSLKEERSAVEGKIQNIGNMKIAAQDFAYAMSDLNATVDSPELQNFTQELIDMSVEFLNSATAAEDYGESLNYINSITKKIESTDLSAMTFDPDMSSSEQIVQIASAYGEVATQVTGMMQQAREALDSNKISMSEYNATIRSGAEAISASYEQTKEALSAEMEDLQEQAGDIDLSGNIEDMPDDVKDLKREYDKLADSLEDTSEASSEFNEQMSDLEKFEDFSKNMEDNYEELAGVFNEDFTISIEAEDLTTDQIDAIESNLHSTFDNFFGNVNWGSENLEEEFNKLSATSQGIVSNMAQRLGVTTTQAMGYLAQLHSKATTDITSMTQTELQQYAALTGGVVTENGEVINSVSGAVGTMIEGIGQIISDFDYTLNFVPSGELNLTLPGLGKLAGEALKSILTGGFNLPIGFSGDLDLNITGEANGDMSAGLSKLQSAADYLKTSGLGDGISLDDFSTPEPTEADPYEFDDPSGVDNDGGGGGSSGDKFEPEEKLDNEDAEKFHERYENLTEELERMTEQLEDYEKAADDAFGVAKYRALQNYEKQLAKIGTRQKALIKETQDYYKKDKNGFLSMSPEIAALARWSDTGEFATLQNPEQIRLYLEQQAQLALETYNNAVDAYNMAGDSSDAAKAQLDNAKTIYDDTIAMLQKQNDALDQLLETEDLMRERINEQVENIREWMSTKVEKYTYAMELQISINDLDVEWMDHLIEQWGDLGIKTGKTWDWLKNNIASAGSNLDATIKNMGQMQTILDNMGSGEYDDEFIAAFGEEAYQEYLDGNGRIPAEVIEQMESNASDMIGYLDDMYSSAEEMLSQYIEILEMYMDEFDKIATKLEQQNDRLDMYQELLEFSGQQYGESGRRARQQIADARVDTAATEVYRAQAQLDVAKTAAEQTRQQLQDFYDQYGTDTSAYSTAEAFTYNHLKEAMDTAEETLDDAQSTMTSSIQDLASAASEAIEAMAQVIKEEVVENLGGDFADFESMTEMYDQQYELDHFFLEDYDKSYQLNKLLGQVGDSMADITDPNRLKEYQSLIDDINGSLQDGVDITQTDVDLLNARFELQQAMDAYEEAQAQKNTMRLARDASGNWSYVYSQDQTQQDDAAQRLADAQYNYEKLLHEARDESEQLWIQMQQEFFEFQESIDWARMQFDQKYRDQIYQQYDYYQRMTENYTGQVIKYNDMLGANFSETTLGIITNYTNMESAQGAYTEQHKIYHAELESNTQHYQTVVSGVCNDVGIDYNDLAKAIDEETSDIMDSNDELKGNIDTLREEAIDDLTAINDKLGPWSRDFIDYMNSAEDSVRSLIQALQDLRREQLAEIEKEQATEDFGPEVEEPTEGVTQAPVETPAEDTSTQKAAAAYENAMEIYHKINRGLYPTGGANRRQQAISEGYTATEYEIAQDLINKVYPVSKRGQGIAWDTAVAQIKAKYFATGGLADYTGPAWVDGSYSKPELVLNADDTKNILSAVSQMREVVKMKMQNMNGNLGRQTDGVTSKTVVNKDIQQVEQSVQIDATFPNVSVAAEIEEALNSLINQVAQYNIKK